MVEKRLYINGYDRTGTFRFGIANGESIPAGIFEARIALRHDVAYFRYS